MMKIKLLCKVVILLISFWSYAQNTSVKKVTFQYRDTLFLDVYTSKTEEASKQPLLVLVHGGGFASGTRDGILESEFCKTMAGKGYTVASISYRLTRKNDPFNCDCATEKKMSSFIDASEDLSAAIHFLYKQTDLVFDKNELILMGSSAGAETILHLAFMGNDYRFSHIPKVPVSGLISLSGAVSNAAYISKNNIVPSLFFHGMKDNLVPYDTAPHHYCEEQRSGYLMLDGPATITEHFNHLGASYILAFDPQGGHNWANYAYAETDIIDRFIQDVVIGKAFVQGTIQLQPKD